MLKIKNWERFQHFKDRNPPWIKLYRDLLDDIDYFSLSDRSGKCLPLIWLIASEGGGVIPGSKLLAFRLRLSEVITEEILDELKTYSFLIESDTVYEKSVSTAKEIAAKNGFGSRHISEVTKREVWVRDGGKCKECETTEDIEFDHIHPVSKGGNSEIDNIQLLCRPCNRKKRAKTAYQAATHAQPLRSLETETETETETDIKKHSRRKQTEIPDNFTVSIAVKEWATKKQITRLDEHVEYFINACKAKKYQYSDWDAALRNAIVGNWAKIDKPNQEKKDWI